MLCFIVFALLAADMEVFLLVPMAVSWIITGLFFT